MENRNVLILGMGLVGRSISCKIAMTSLFNKVIVVDKLDHSAVVKEIFDTNSNIEYEFHQLKITPSTLGDLSSLLTENECCLLIDSSYNIDTLDLLKSLPKGVAFINSSVEEWPLEDETPVYSTLKSRQDQIKEWYVEFRPKNNILLDCGMNPGLVNLWAWDCARKNNFDFNKVKQVIVSEFDTQISNKPRKEGEFLNTWSPNGFLEEVHAPIEGYSLGQYFSDDSVTGYETVSKSMRPNGQPFFGYTVRHAETITMNKLFPAATLMYIYKCPESAVTSLFEYQEVMPLKSERILYTQDISEGIDELGVVMGDSERLVWYGSYLGNEDAKRLYGPLAKFINATSIQVVGGLWIGINFLLNALAKNTIHRLLTPEDMVEDENFIDEILAEVNADLKMGNVVFPRENEQAQKMINNASFPQHFKNYQKVIKN